MKEITVITKTGNRIKKMARIEKYIADNGKEFSVAYTSQSAYDSTIVDGEEVFATWRNFQDLRNRGVI